MSGCGRMALLLAWLWASCLTHACAHRLLLLVGVLPLLFFPATCRGVAVPRCWLIPGVISVSCGLRVCGLKVVASSATRVFAVCWANASHSGVVCLLCEKGGVSCVQATVCTPTHPLCTCRTRHSSPCLPPFLPILSSHPEKRMLCAAHSRMADCLVAARLDSKLKLHAAAVAAQRHNTWLSICFVLRQLGPHHAGDSCESAYAGCLL